MTDWDRLRSRIAGQVLTATTPGYDRARQPAIGQFDRVRPSAVVRCSSDEDVAETIAFVRESGLPLAIRGGGHDFAGRSSTEGVLLDTSPLTGLSVVDDQLVAGAGARLAGVYDALGEHGRTLPAGCGPTVGIAGLALGGGMGVLGRRYGLTLDQLRAARVVLSDGTVVDCDENHEPDLFWALRGAGCGNFGVVTRLTLDTVPAPTARIFHLTWPYVHAATLATAWQEWLATAPGDIDPALHIAAPADPAASPVVHLFGAMTGTSDPLSGFLEQVPAPGTEIRLEVSYRETKRYMAEHGAGEDLPGGHPYGKSEFIDRPLPADVVTALIEGLVEGRAAGEVRALEFLPWGRAYNQVRPDATAFPHRNALYLFKHSLTITPGTEPAAAFKWLTRSWELARPWGTGGVYSGFPDPDLEDWPAAYYGGNYPRLRDIKTRYDPDGFFRSVQSIPAHPAQEGSIA